MPLIPCPVCNREISAAAPACPGCGHPLADEAAEAPQHDAPQCHACSAPATLRCQGCDRFSCARHVRSIPVGSEEGLFVEKLIHEFRCERCRKQTADERTLWWNVAVVLSMFAAVVGVALIFLKQRPGNP